MLKGLGFDLFVCNPGGFFINRYGPCDGLIKLLSTIFSNIAPLSTHESSRKSLSLWRSRKSSLFCENCTNNESVKLSHTILAPVLHLPMRGSTCAVGGSKQKRLVNARNYNSARNYKRTESRNRPMKYAHGITNARNYNSRSHFLLQGQDMQ